MRDVLCVGDCIIVPECSPGTSWCLQVTVLPPLDPLHPLDILLHLLPTVLLHLVRSLASRSLWSCSAFCDVYCLACCVSERLCAYFHHAPLLQGSPRQVQPTPLPAQDTLPHHQVRCCTLSFAYCAATLSLLFVHVLLLVRCQAGPNVQWCAVQRIPQPALHTHPPALHTLQPLLVSSLLFESCLWTGTCQCCHPFTSYITYESIHLWSFGRPSISLSVQVILLHHLRCLLRRPTTVLHPPPTVQQALHVGGLLQTTAQPVQVCITMCA